MSRELSSKGLQDRKFVTELLMDKQIDIILSSPYKRAVDTVRDFAEIKGIDIIVIDEFKERRVDRGWIEDFNSFCKKQWEDFSYKLSDGESLKEVQSRNVLALNRVLENYEGLNIVIGSHGTALSTIINYYDKTFGYSDFEKIRYLMPWVVRFTFLEIDPSEEKFHFLLHQKISKIITREYFDINDQDILDAVECHTTLKQNAGIYDKVSVSVQMETRLKPCNLPHFLRCPHLAYVSVRRNRPPCKWGKLLRLRSQSQKETNFCPCKALERRVQRRTRSESNETGTKICPFLTVLPSVH